MTWPAFAVTLLAIVFWISILSKVKQLQTGEYRYDVFLADTARRVRIDPRSVVLVSIAVELISLALFVLEMRWFAVLAVLLLFFYSVVGAGSLPFWRASNYSCRCFGIDLLDARSGVVLLLRNAVLSLLAVPMLLTIWVPQPRPDRAFVFVATFSALGVAVVLLGGQSRVEAR